ncbi:transcription factor MYB64-like [Telopea speciosissima]|uniref:transcription factor MYB64-like n=1 Tax=Telopea speciosissima TaxID=54955 RepID=UPI001CC5B03B|nr:transcription factor MYB64-like [Telopea speciosissima]
MDRSEGMRETLGSASGFSEFSASGGLLQDISFVDGLFAEGIEESFNGEKAGGGVVGKRMKGGASANLIKGQWTDEEDRLLVTLVKQYGERKWAQIAQKLVGRAGKQCRERWHNHLRPDIKKDTWSEEEERLLIEAHEQVGNKWAEIAKRIPGRTENSIKNHWNATKRRQNSKRKNKKAQSQGEKVQLSILQDYIRKKTLNNDNSSGSSSSSSSSALISTSTPSKDGSLQSLFAHSYNEELLFIQKFFENIYKHSSDGTAVVGCAEEEAFYDGHLQELLSLDSLYSFNDDLATFIKMDDGVGSSSTNPRTNIDNANKGNEFLKEDTSGSHLWSDLYLAYLLNGVSSSTSSSSSSSFTTNDNYYCENPNMDLMSSDQTPSNGKKEMDLIEMVSSSHQFSISK